MTSDHHRSEARSRAPSTADPRRVLRHRARRRTGTGGSTSTAHGVAYLRLDVDEDGGLVPGLRAEDEQLRPRRRHRALRRRPAAAVRAPRGRAPSSSPAPRTASSAPAPTSGCWPRPAQLEGELLQVHQRDPQRHRGRHRALRARPRSPRSTAPRPAAATSWRWPATQIVLVDDNSSAVSLPEVPLLGVLPGTGGLTRVVDKRGVRQDLADVLRHHVRGHPRRAGRRVAAGRRGDRQGAQLGRDGRPSAPPRPPRRRPDPAPAPRASQLTPLQRARPTATPPATGTCASVLDREPGTAEITVLGPRATCPDTVERAARAGRRVLAAGHHPRARRPDPAAAHQRAASSAPGCCAPRATSSDVARLRRVRCWHTATTGWSTRSSAYFKRTLKRLDITSPQPDRADRAGQLLRRLAAGAGASPPTARTCSTGQFEDDDDPRPRRRVIRARRVQLRPAARWATT